MKNETVAALQEDLALGAYFALIVLAKHDSAEPVPVTFERQWAASFLLKAAAHASERDARPLLLSCAVAVLSKPAAELLEAM